VVKKALIKRAWIDFITVWSLITRIRIPGVSRNENFSLPSAEAMIALPLAGGLFGLLSALPAWLAAKAIPHQGAAWIACALYAALGWSIHLDGWGDLWDGIGSGKRGDELRRVLKDPRAGAFSVAAITLAIGTRAALMADIDPAMWLEVCLVSCGVGRFGANVAACLGKYPWEEGMGRDIVRNFGWRQLACSAVAAIALFPFAPKAFALGMITSSLGGAALAGWAEKNLGGVNGDVIGASAVLGEILTMAGYFVL
jgi:adenosylcobinamide-GDP ribazoletransferase